MRARLVASGDGAHLYGLAALAVVALAHDAHASAAAPRQTLALVLAIVVLAAGLAARAATDVWRTPAAAAWLALTGWMLLSLCWGDHQPDLGLCSLLTAASGLLLWLRRRAPADRRRLAEDLATAVGGVSAGAALAQAATGRAPLEIDGLAGNPSWLGLVLAVTLPLQVAAGARAIDRARLTRRPLAWLAAVGRTAAVLATTLVLLESRSATAVAALLGALAIALVLALRGRARSAVGLAVAAAVAGVAFAGQSALSASWLGRLWIWRVAVDAAIAASPLGHGAGRFPFAFLDAQGRHLGALPPAEAATRFVNATTAHCDWLHLWVEGGPIAPLLLGAVIVAGTATLARRWRAGALSLVVAGVAAAGDAALHQPAVVLLVVAVVAGCPATLRERGRGGRAIALATGLAAGVACAALLPPAVRRWRSERVLFVARDLDLAARGDALRRAHRLDPRSGEAALLLGLHELQTGRPAAARQALGEARERLANLGTDVADGNAAMALGAPAEAERCYRRALARHPAYFRARANLVEALAAQGKLAEAERDLAEARALQPGHPKLAVIAERLRRARIEAETRAD